MVILQVPKTDSHAHKISTVRCPQLIVNASQQTCHLVQRDSHGPLPSTHNKHASLPPSCQTECLVTRIAHVTAT